MVHRVLALDTDLVVGSSLEGVAAVANGDDKAPGGAGSTRVADSERASPPACRQPGSLRSSVRMVKLAVSGLSVRDGDKEEGLGFKVHQLLQRDLPGGTVDAADTQAR